MSHHKQSLLADVIDGAIAGAIATWAMGKVTGWLYEHEDRDARQREDQARGGKTSYGVAAEKAARLMGVELSNEERQKYGIMIHWALGITAGAWYGALRPRLENAGVAKSLTLGTAFWLLTDEGVVYALKLTPGPTAFPWQTHARGLAGHLAFGAAADVALAALQPERSSAGNR